MAQVFGIERHRTNLKREKEEVEVAFGVTSLSTEKANRAQMLAYNRNQWSIENEVHILCVMSLSTRIAAVFGKKPGRRSWPRCAI